MYYHIKITKKNGNIIYLYDKDESYAKQVKTKFTGKDEFIIDGNKLFPNELVSCKIIKTPWDIELEKNNLYMKFPNHGIYKEQVFNEYENIFDEL